MKRVIYSFSLSYNSKFTTEYFQKILKYSIYNKFVFVRLCVVVWASQFYRFN